MTALAVAIVVSVAMLCATRLAGRWLDIREDRAAVRDERLDAVERRLREVAAFMDRVDAEMAATRKDTDDLKALAARNEVWK